LAEEYYFFCSIQASDDVQFDGWPTLLKNNLYTLQLMAVQNNNASDKFNTKWKDFNLGLFYFPYLAMGNENLLS